jgi:prepilin-type N-terminal cleavage/methylation domain-containing protein
MKSPNSISFFRRRSHAAFTLIEVLVAMAVLAIIVVMVANLLSSATSVTTLSNNHMDADNQARIVFDRMALDFARLIKRKDVDYYIKQTSGNDQIAFYSEAGGYYPSGVTGNTPKGTVSLIGYRINDNKLERLSKALIWNGVTASTPGATGISLSTDKAMAFLPQKLITTWPTIVGASDPDPNPDPDYQILSDQVYRMEFCFLLKPVITGGVTTTASALALKPSYSAVLNDYTGFKDVSAIVVTLAVLDSRSRASVTAANFSTAIGKLADFSLTPPTGYTTPQAPLLSWQANVASQDLGLPVRAASQVQIYQRYFYLDPTL